MNVGLCVLVFFAGLAKLHCGAMKLDHKRLGMHVKLRQENACEVIKLEGNATDDVITDALAAARSQSPSSS